METQVDIPMDVYESTTELVVIMPLGGVAKRSIKLSLEGNNLTLAGSREKPSMKDTLMPIQEKCFWGAFEKVIALPSSVYFDRIHSELSKDNVLTIIIPKVIVPERIMVHLK